jgi:hypothetical protein
VTACYVQIVGPSIPNGESEMLIAWLDTLIRDGEHDLAREVLTDAYSWAYYECRYDDYRQAISTTGSFGSVTITPLGQQVTLTT